MKSIFEFITGLWFGFSIFLAIFIYGCYDCKNENGLFFVFEDQVYWVGILGEIDYD